MSITVQLGGVTLYQQANSGSQTGTSQWEHVYKCSKGLGATAFVALQNIAKTGARFPGDGRYVNFNSSRLSSDIGFDTIFVVTSNQFTACIDTYDRPDGTNEYNLAGNDIEKQLEVLENYRTCWNNDLFFSCEASKEKLLNPEVPDVPTWWETAKNTYLEPGLQSVFRWSESQPSDFTMTVGGKSVVFRWLMLKERTKKGVEVKPFFAPIVVERRYFDTWQKASLGLRKANTHVEPKITFFYGNGPENWIIKPQGIDFDGHHWIAVNHYIYADMWDKEVYDK